MGEGSRAHLSNQLSCLPPQTHSAHHQSLLLSGTLWAFRALYPNLHCPRA